MPQHTLVEAGTFKHAAKSSADLSDLALVKAGAFGTKAIDETARTVDFVISTAAEDRDDDIISLSGWQLGNFRANPVVLWAHDYSEPPVGKSLSETVDGAALRSQCQFTDRDESPFGFMTFRLVVGGYLNATSVGFRPIKWAWNEERGSWAIDYIEQELLEYSIVPVPANPQALIEARGKGIDTSPMIGWAEKKLDEMGESAPGLLIPRRTLEAARKAAGAAEVSTFVPAKMGATGRPVQSPEYRAAVDTLLVAGAAKAADAQGERFLLPMTAETSYAPFPWDPMFLARMLPVQMPHYYAALTNAATLPRQTFRLAELTATQNRVDTAKVQAMRGHTGERSAPPVVVRQGGRLCIADGHHGLSADWLDGKDAVECGFKDLDASTDGLSQTGQGASAGDQSGPGAEAAPGTEGAASGEKAGDADAASKALAEINAKLAPHGIVARLAGTDLIVIGDGKAASALNSLGKAGRVLSAANEAALVEARGLIDAMIAQVEENASGGTDEGKALALRRQRELDLIAMKG